MTPRLLEPLLGAAEARSALQASLGDFRGKRHELAPQRLEDNRQLGAWSRRARTHREADRRSTRLPSRPSSTAEPSWLRVAGLLAITCRLPAETRRFVTLQLDDFLQPRPEPGEVARRSGGDPLGLRQRRGASQLLDQACAADAHVDRSFGGFRERSPRPVMLGSAMRSESSTIARSSPILGSVARSW